jgi:hypothetical protein
MNETIDITPTWTSLVPLFALLLSQDELNREARQLVTQELFRMAEAADRFNSQVKGI